MGGGWLDFFKLLTHPCHYFKSLWVPATHE